MKPSERLALKSKDVVVSVSAGSALGIFYDTGTVGVIHCDHNGDGEVSRTIRFTRSAILDFGYFDSRNWEVLRHCLNCRGLTTQRELSRCETCHRQDYCPACINQHYCHVPDAGVSRDPRQKKGNGKC
jgi:hypothetical protein